MTTTYKYPEVQVRLVGEDGTAFAILGRVQRALRKHGVGTDEINAFHKEATAGDYNHLLRTCMAWVDTDTLENDDEEWE